jgi:transposase-like protein
VLPVDAAFVEPLDRILDPAAAREVDVARWQLRHWLHRASERIRAGPRQEVHSRDDD